MKKLWVEQYRPKTIDEYVWRDESQRRQVLTWIKEKTLPTLLLGGLPGTGKTSLAKLLISEVGVQDADFMEVNASRETGIDFIRERIVPFISSIAWGPFKVILLDEADRLSIQAQDSLKGIIEEYSDYARFILTCNSPHKIVPALHSRCQQFNFTKLDTTEFTARAATILVNENVDFDLDTLDNYVKLTYPDLRKCINLLQQNTADNKLHSPDKDEAGTKEWKFDMIKLFKAGQINEARRLVCSNILAEEMEEVYRFCYDNLPLFGATEQQQDQAVLIIKQGLVDHAICADPEICLAATLIRLARNAEQ